MLMMNSPKQETKRNPIQNSYQKNQLFRKIFNQNEKHLNWKLSHTDGKTSLKTQKGGRILLAHGLDEIISLKYLCYLKQPIDQCNA